PGERLRSDAGTVATAGLTTLLDEAAFWLGALATGEAGMTMDLRVSLHRPAVFGTRLTVSGLRARVRPHADDPRYWQTETAIPGGPVSAAGRPRRSSARPRRAAAAPTGRVAGAQPSSTQRRHSSARWPTASLEPKRTSGVRSRRGSVSARSRSRSGESPPIRRPSSSTRLP